MGFLTNAFSIRHSYFHRVVVGYNSWGRTMIDWRVCSVCKEQHDKIKMRRVIVSLKAVQYVCKECSTLEFFWVMDYLNEPDAPVYLIE